MAKDLRAYLSNRRTGLPKPIPAEEAVTQIERLHGEKGGATFSLYFGDVVGQELFAVSLYPERSVQVRGRFVSARRLRAFLGQNQDLLSDPRNSVGIWYNEDDDTTYLDVTATLPDRAAVQSNRHLRLASWRGDCDGRNGRTAARCAS